MCPSLRTYACGFLILASNPQIEATAAFHELEAAQGDVRELEEGDDGPLQVAKAVYEWYDERF